MTFDALHAGKSDDEIVTWLCEYFRRPHQELDAELARLFLHKTKSRWQRYMSKFAPASGKAGRPKALGMKGVLALVELDEGFTQGMRLRRRWLDGRRLCLTPCDDGTALLFPITRCGGFSMIDIGFEWNGRREYSRDIERITTGDLVTIMKLPHRLNFTDCFDEGNIRAVLKRVNDIPPGTVPIEPPDTGDSIIE